MHRLLHEDKNTNNQQSNKKHGDNDAVTKYLLLSNWRDALSSSPSSAYNNINDKTNHHHPAAHDQETSTMRTSTAVATNNGDSNSTKFTTINGKTFSDRLHNIKQKQPGHLAEENNHPLVFDNDYMDEKPTADEIRWVCCELRKPIQHQSFLIKLYNALKECERDNMDHVFHWLPHGRAFIIDDVKKFEEIVLPKYLKMDRYNSFVKQCSVYNLERLTTCRNRSGPRYHPCFLKGKMFLCRRVKRTRVKGHNIRPAAVFPEPNLFALRPCVDSENENDNERKKIERWMKWTQSEVYTVEDFMLLEERKAGAAEDPKSCEEEEGERKKKAIVEMTMVDDGSHADHRKQNSRSSSASHSSNNNKVNNDKTNPAAHDQGTSTMRNSTAAAKNNEYNCEFAMRCRRLAMPHVKANMKKLSATSDEEGSEPNQNSARKKKASSWSHLMILRKQQERDKEVNPNTVMRPTAGEAAAAAAAHRQERCNPRPSLSQRAPAMILHDHLRKTTTIMDNKTAMDALPTTEAIVATVAKVSNNRGGEQQHRHPHTASLRAKPKNTSESMNFDLLHEQNHHHLNHSQAQPPRPDPVVRCRSSYYPIDIPAFDSFVEHVYQMTMRNEQAWLQEQQQQEGDNDSSGNAAQFHTISSSSKKIDWLFHSEVGGGADDDNNVNSCNEVATVPSRAGRDYSGNVLNGTSIEEEKHHGTELPSQTNKCSSPLTEEPALNDRQASIEATTTTTRTNSVESSDGASMSKSRFALSVNRSNQNKDIQPRNIDDDHRENQAAKSNPNGSGSVVFSPLKMLRFQQEKKQFEHYQNRMSYLKKIRVSLKKDKLDVLGGEREDRKSHSSSLPSLHLINYAENNSDGSSEAKEATKGKDESGEQRIQFEESNNLDEETSRIQKQEEEMALMEEDFLLDIVGY